jgi:hypothetical protein
MEAKKDTEPRVTDELANQSKQSGAGTEESKERGADAEKTMREKQSKPPQSQVNHAACKVPVEAEYLKQRKWESFSRNSPWALGEQLYQNTPRSGCLHLPVEGLRHRQKAATRRRKIEFLITWDRNDGPGLVKRRLQVLPVMVQQGIDSPAIQFDALPSEGQVNHAAFEAGFFNFRFSSFVGATEPFPWWRFKTPVFCDVDPPMAGVNRHLPPRIGVSEHSAGESYQDLGL